MKKTMLAVIAVLLFAFSASAAEWQCGTAISNPYLKQSNIILASMPYESSLIVAANETVADFLSANLSQEKGESKDLCVKGSQLPDDKGILVYAIRVK
jgi:hypothetical protein